jgi:hypothetical protein
MKANAIADFRTAPVAHNLSTAQPGQGEVVAELGGRDDNRPALHPRPTARPHLTLILGGVDSGFVHSLDVRDRDGNQVEL